MKHFLTPAIKQVIEANAVKPGVRGLKRAAQNHPQGHRQLLEILTYPFRRWHCPTVAGIPGAKTCLSAKKNLKGIRRSHGLSLDLQWAAPTPQH